MRLLLVMMWVSLMSGTAVAPLAVRAAEALDPHAPLQERCDSCHNGTVDVSSLVQTAQTHCSQCHEAPATPGGLVKTATPTASSPTSERPPITLGMRYPLFNDETRLGDQPNDMVLVPAGEFSMGTDDRLFDEGPQHRVTLPAFMIDIYEVTNLQYEKFSHESGRRSPKHFRNRTYPSGKADHPVTFVSWYDAKEYCEWAGKRLPTDQEWEKAARGSDGRIYAWGNDFALDKANTPQRWAKIGQQGDTTPVGAFAGGASPYGLYDMSGNVWEWTSSWYQPYPGSQAESENYGERYKTLKGGSWFDCSFYKCGISAPVFNRSFFALRVKNDTFGFRCAKDVAK